MTRELGDHCYNIPSESIYGEITANSILKLCSDIKFDNKINILDIGSGSGYSLCNFAKAFSRDQCNLIGIEISNIRADLSRTIIPKIIPPNVNQWEIIEMDILKLSYLPSCNLCFSFDKTFTQDLMIHIAHLQLKCSSLKYIISCHGMNIYKIENWIEMKRVPCRLRGSGQIITFFIYIKKI